MPMPLVTLGDNLRVSKISACRKIIHLILEEKPFASLGVCLYELYGTPLFNAIPKGLRNSILFEYFEGDAQSQTVCQRLLPFETPLTVEEVSSILLSKGYLGDAFPVYSFHTRTFDKKYKEVEEKLKRNGFYSREEAEYAYLYFYELNKSLEEEKVALKYLNRLREAFEEGGIQYEESLKLLPEIERQFLLSSELHPKDIYFFFTTGPKEEGEV